MLKHLLFTTLAFLLMAGCASSDKKQHHETEASYPKLKKPGQNPHKKGTAYIDSVKKVTSDSVKALIIAGNLADGCTHIESVSHTIEGDSLILNLSAWRNKSMCTQALVPFSFLYEELDAEQLARFKTATLNGKTYTL